jgi:hypothetical protein
VNIITIILYGVGEREEGGDQISSSKIDALPCLACIMVVRENMQILLIYQGITCPLRRCRATTTAHALSPYPGELASPSLPLSLSLCLSPYPYHPSSSCPFLSVLSPLQNPSRLVI